jgi:hypothetical protein
VDTGSFLFYMRLAYFLHCDAVLTQLHTGYFSLISVVSQRLPGRTELQGLVWCFVIGGAIEVMDFYARLGANRRDSCPIARICNDVWREKTRLYGFSNCEAPHYS